MAVSVVKDECDIIELFVRATLEWADELHVVDNGSSDFTPQILRLLMEEGLPLFVASDTSIDHQQGRIITRLTRDAVGSRGADFVVPIDADEFVQAPSRLLAALHEVRDDMVATLCWIGLVPRVEPIWTHASPLHTYFFRRMTELRNVTKVVLPRAVALVTNVSEGNHHAVGRSGAVIPEVRLGLSLAHAPIRSPEQILTKALVGSLKLSIKESRRPDEGFHWDHIAGLLRSMRYRLCEQDLRRLAIAYGNSVHDPALVQIEPVALETHAHGIRYPELAAIDPVARLDGFATALCDEVHRSRLRTGHIGTALRRLARRLS